jgi:hypothetical protein
MLTNAMMLIISIWLLITWYLPVKFARDIKLLKKEYRVEVRKMNWIWSVCYHEWYDFPHGKAFHSLISLCIQHVSSCIVLSLWTVTLCKFPVKGSRAFIQQFVCHYTDYCGSRKYSNSPVSIWDIWL